MPAAGPAGRGQGHPKGDRGVSKGNTGEHMLIPRGVCESCGWVEWPRELQFHETHGETQCLQFPFRSTLCSCSPLQPAQVSCQHPMCSGACGVPPAGDHLSSSHLHVPTSDWLLCLR